MLRFFAERALDRFSKRFDYDVSYMRAILKASPRAFMRLHELTKGASHRETAPNDAYYAAKLVGAMAEDCGPCTQLVVNMAYDARVPEPQIEAVLTRNMDAMNADTILGFRFAEAIVSRLAHEDEVRDAVRAQWGEKGLIDLTYALQVGRVFPMIKAGLGYAHACRRIMIGEKPIDLVRRAA
ncbi:MAG: hypothetical protein A4S17_00770 [Proteobacteria bacterium HN_bin10]|nr:MAG: hypothetical protein A4S17_00770 [Proteobacteria bacterium HN_bin10]